MKKLYGVITAMTTPFTDDGKVDTAALEQQVDFLIDKGINCLYPCGTSGEMHLMTVEERELVAETVVRKAAGRVTVFIQAGAVTEADTVRLAQHALRIGADGVGVVTPCYFSLDERAMVEYYKRVCTALPNDFPVYVYVIPQLAHNDISAETMERIADACTNVVGVKYSYPDVRRINEYLQVRNGNFSVLPGSDDLFLACLACGCDGVVSGCSGPFPEAFVEIYRAFRAGDLEKARLAQMKATKLARIMKLGGDMSIFKHILTWRGVTGGHMKKPLLDLTKEEADQLKEVVSLYL